MTDIEKELLEGVQANTEAIADILRTKSGGAGVRLSASDGYIVREGARIPFADLRAFVTTAVVTLDMDGAVYSPVRYGPSSVIFTSPGEPVKTVTVAARSAYDRDSYVTGPSETAFLKTSDLSSVLGNDGLGKPADAGAVGAALVEIGSALAGKAPAVISNTTDHKIVVVDGDDVWWIVPGAIYYWNDGIEGSEVHSPTSVFYLPKALGEYSHFALTSGIAVTPGDLREFSRRYIGVRSAGAFVLDPDSIGLICYCRGSDSLAEGYYVSDGLVGSVVGGENWTPYEATDGFRLLAEAARSSAFEIPSGAAVSGAYPTASGMTVSGGRTVDVDTGTAVYYNVTGAVTFRLPAIAPARMLVHLASGVRASDVRFTDPNMHTVVTNASTTAYAGTITGDRIGLSEAWKMVTVRHFENPQGETIVYLEV